MPEPTEQEVPPDEELSRLLELRKEILKVIDELQPPNDAEAMVEFFILATCLQELDQLIEKKKEAAKQENATPDPAIQDLLSALTIKVQQHGPKSRPENIKISVPQENENKVKKDEQD